MNQDSRDRGAFVFAAVFAIVIMGSFLFVLNHHSKKVDHVSVLGIAEGYPDRLSATINIVHGKDTLKYHQGQTATVLCYGADPKTSIVSLQGVPVDGELHRYGITEGVGRQLVWNAYCNTTFSDGTTKRDDVYSGAWQSPNNRTCRLRNLPCANN